MLPALVKKEDFLTALIREKRDRSAGFGEFSRYFYRHVSLGYLESISRQNSDIFLKIAEEAHAILKDPPLADSLKVRHAIYDENKAQALFLHGHDKRFTVSGVSIWLKNNGIQVDEIIHPIFSTVRDETGTLKEHDRPGGQAESLICVIFPINAKLPKDYETDLKAIYKKLLFVADDFIAIQEKLGEIEKNYLSHANERVRQTGEFLKWLDSKHFIFLGLRRFDIRTGERDEIAFEPRKCDQKYGVFNLDEILNDKALLPSHLTVEGGKNELIANHLSHIAKKHERSDIYKGSSVNSIELLDMDANHAIVGLVQIIGLFTSEFYKASPLEVPYLKHKAENVYNLFGFHASSHDGRLLRNILDSIPLDEFFYLNETQIADLTNRVLNMHDKSAVFIRNDEFAKTVSILMYMPKHRYSEELRTRLGDLVVGDIGGSITSSHGFVDDTSFARLIYVITYKDSETIRLKAEEELETELWLASQTWQERFEYFCRRLKIPSDIFFSKAYAQATLPQEAAADAATVYGWFAKNAPVHFDIVVREKRIVVRVFQKESALTLGQIMPIFANFHLNVQSEKTFFAESKGTKIWMHHYETQDLDESALSEKVKTYLLDGLYAAWNQEIEVDPFNALTVTCGLDFKEIIIFRALGRYLKQLGSNYSQRAMADCLAAYPSITRLTIDYFYRLFSVNVRARDLTEKSPEDAEAREAVIQELTKVARLDHDRILRGYLNSLDAILRTNAFENGALHPYPVVSFKFDSERIIDMPKPAPFAEIFVYSPTMEACHLRGGKIARGGIRWSDRPEDFRFEILGLMKAQMVKNAIIVPLGSKGGFVIKNYMAMLESGASKETLKKTVLAEYSVFMEQILRMTDNFTDAKIVAPLPIHYDKEDPYLVVAADKGTASFSDTANAIAEKHDFWLGDAFASGGSKGYDHKKLGITARGAWIAVKRHFWELGVDPRTQPISVVGVGDMSGDVFGNGMLRSNQIKLVAAFNHAHVFLDPDPNPETSYAERLRLFEKPYSTWDDYNRNHISTGGGVYARSLKSIPISAEVAEKFGIARNSLSPDELISKLLTAKVDLLWFGGIGTFVKAHTESNTMVADRVNDAIRVNARDVRAKVIGEGANLGVTQLGRVEYALNEGRINTDAIDNSAGVSCSDHEVNLKIMCRKLIEKNALSKDRRDELLASVSDAVCELVLEDNRSQTLLLARSRRESKNDLDSFVSLIKELESSHVLPLNREVEFIPSDEDLARRKTRNLGLTAPELAVIVAYAKIHLYGELTRALRSSACFGEIFYERYFPEAFRKKCGNLIHEHPLKIEITATVLANLAINVMGPCFASQMAEAFQSDLAEIVRVFAEIMEVADFDDWLAIGESPSTDFESTLSAYGDLKINIARCVMLRLKFPHLVLRGKYFANAKDSSVPYAVSFADRLLNDSRDDDRLAKNYEKLSLATLWEWAAKNHPTTGWEVAAWLTQQSDLIISVVDLCNRDWNEASLAKYFKFFEKCQGYMGSLQDPKQGSSLLDYIIKNLSTKTPR